MQEATNKVTEIQAKDPWEVEWDRCKHWIAEAVKHQDFYTIEDIKDKIKVGMFHLWPGKKSAMVTELVTFPQGTSIKLLFCGGDYSELEEMLPSYRNVCKRIRMQTLIWWRKKRMVRKIKHLGFQEEYMVRKEL